MATHKVTRSRPIRTSRKLEFPQAKGKTVELVELSVAEDDYSITVRFEDKTALHFDVAPCVAVLSALEDWKTGELQVIKRWKPIRSQSK
jgi:hypothetical protein